MWPIGNSAHGNHRVEYDAAIYSHGERDGPRFFLRDDQHLVTPLRVIRVRRTIARFPQLCPSGVIMINMRRPVRRVLQQQVFSGY